MKEDRYKRKAVILLNEYNKIIPTNLDEKRIDKTNYTRVIEKLIYIIIYTRPDIVFALGKLSQFISNLTIRYSYEIKELLRYLRFNSNISIIYQGKENKIIQLIEYSDTNYIIDRDDRKSIIE